MATMTRIAHIDRPEVAPYIAAASLARELAAPLFSTAMTSTAIRDPYDKSYNAWWTIRAAAGAFLENCTLRMTPGAMLDLKEALHTAHANSHPVAADPPHYLDCHCDTAAAVRSLLQLLAGAPAGKAAQRARCI